jgi:hypothetical protein
VRSTISSEVVLLYICNTGNYDRSVCFARKLSCRSREKIMCAVCFFPHAFSKVGSTWSEKTIIL